MSRILEHMMYVEGEIKLINHQNGGINQHLEQLALRHFAQAQHFKVLKNVYVNDSSLYYQYGEQQYYHKALAHRYRAMITRANVPNKTVAEFTGDITQTSPSNRSLIDLLRKGGYILYARHGEATVGKDQTNLNFQDCSTQRNLSQNGKRQAITYGESLRSLDIPVQYPVLVSPLCRAIETAELAFGEGNVQVDPFWFETYKLGGNLSSAEQERVLNTLQSVLEIRPPLGSNKLIIAHSFPKGVGLGQISDMGTVVVKPHEQGQGYEVIAQVSLEELKDLL